MIGVVDIGIGNTESVYKVLRRFEQNFIPVQTDGDFKNISKIIFPGVGSFEIAVKRLDEFKLREPLTEFIQQGKPYLGICLGMQLLARTGYEGTKSRGLCILDAEVIKMALQDGHPLPHIGWNSVSHDGAGLFRGLPKSADFYFVNSYYMHLKENAIKYDFEYGGKFTAYVEKDNVYGAQFHPEKSQSFGQRFIENFLQC